MSNYLLGKMGVQNIIMLVLLAIMVVVLIVLPMFTNRRRNKAINDLHSSLAAGDIIKTVGGIVGKIVEIRDISPQDKEMVIETGVGDNKSTMVFDIQAVYQIVSKGAGSPVAAQEPFTQTTSEESVKTEEVHEEIVPTVSEDVTEKTDAPVEQAEAASEESVATELKRAAKPKKK